MRSPRNASMQFRHSTFTPGLLGRAACVKEVHLHLHCALQLARQASKLGFFNMPPALSDYDSDGSLIYNTIEAENVKEPPSAVSQSPARHSSAPAPSGKFVKQSLRPDTRSATVGTSHSSSRFSSSTKSPAFASFEKPKSLRGKKRSALLAGIGPENIISQSENEEEALAKNTPPTSSISTSSYRTRRQVHGSQKSEVCYDQKYHPMDDVMNPTRAAKVKSKYGEELPVSDDILFFSDVDDGGNESDVEMHIDAEPMKKVKNKFCQPTRRSGRQMNNSVIYNTSVHPQDNDIEEGERTDWVLVSV
ncbi:hypothetical protein K491DRAFT_247078 [Lophiostoma macrostomum CBS 122681]|uniref:Uncharacterized protein n=1 Tax=Lophiostoma macrostomum CBS 122681 TaxID=1314788 RepID=A0A6A6THW5_9PLEO|nr:hypothetical protein K491DRAFT_247078 [Lophiostoma macrostomum CBS 122681]